MSLLLSEALSWSPHDEMSLVAVLIETSKLRDVAGYVPPSGVYTGGDTILFMSNVLLVATSESAQPSLYDMALTVYEP